MNVPTIHVIHTVYNLDDHTTELKSYVKCEKDADYYVVYKIQQPPNFKQHFGSAVHQTCPLSELCSEYFMPIKLYDL